MGGVIGFAAVNQLPDAYAGLLLGDAPVIVHDAALVLGYTALCQAFTGALAAGQFVDASFGPLSLALAELERTAPNAASPIIPGATNRQAYMLFLTTPSAGPPASVFATGVILATGDVAQDRFFVASEARLNAGLSAANYYIPNGTFRDLMCAFAGDATFTSNLSRYHGPVLSFELGNGLAAWDNASIALTSSRDVDVVSYPGFGHVDLLASPDHQRLFEDRIVRWVYGDTLLR
jgi:hypothetical protein